MRDGRRLIVALVLLLGLALFSYFAGREDTESNPSAASTYPSGLAAFRELLRQEGYTVVVDGRAKPNLGSAGLAIVPTFEATDVNDKTAEKTNKALSEWLSKGGTILELRLPRDFAAASRSFVATKVDSSFTGRPLMVTSGIRQSSPLSFNFLTTEFPLVSNGTTNLVELRGAQGGLVASVPNAILATNRFLGRYDNAEFLSKVVGRLANPNRAVVIVEAVALGPVELGLLAQLGSWAAAAWWQFLLVVLVVLVTASRRFGLPISEQSLQRSGRHLVDAFAGVLTRGRKQGFAAQVLADRALEEARAIQRVPVGSDKDRVLRNAPADFVEAYQTLMQADTLSEGQILANVQRLHRSLDDVQSWDRTQSRT